MVNLWYHTVFSVIDHVWMKMSVKYNNNGLDARNGSELSELNGNCRDNSDADLLEASKVLHLALQQMDGIIASCDSLMSPDVNPSLLVKYLNTSSRPLPPDYSPLKALADIDLNKTYLEIKCWSPNL
ncbi:unnamed protein product [Oppiella nova]|uniref:Uncharacterized protein n=1 Tax=Oppiella nova TaxID=334625 RepID=A0A7R9M263_9ACAR|nr:unnamed protein product [Oppiella nova]CAG2169159.1 unnamed protein product [Oppiella nova]